MAKVKQETETLTAEAESRILTETGERTETEKSKLSTAVKSEKELIAEEIARNEEYVEIELFYDGGKYSDDVYVAIGNENCVIKRGRKVRVKRKFALAIEESVREERHVAAVIKQEREKAQY